MTSILRIVKDLLHLVFTWFLMEKRQLTGLLVCSSIYFTSGGIFGSVTCTAKTSLLEISKKCLKY